jgi:cobalamin biosynthesis protein CobD/CbiB
MVLDSRASETNYYSQLFLLLSMLVEVTTITRSAAVKMLTHHEIRLCLTLKVDKCAARLLQSYNNGRQFSTIEKHERL